MDATNTLQTGEAQSRQPVNRPVIETLEKYRWDILNTISSNSGTQRQSSQNSLEFLNALNSLISQNTEFTNILRGMWIANYAATIAQLRREVAWNTPNIRFEDLPGHNDVQVMIAALAEYRRHQAMEQQNNFDAIYLWQTGETESSTAQQIEAAAQRAKLTGGALYYRNKVPLRISWVNNQFEAQYLDLNGQPSNQQWIQTPDITILVSEIHTRSQRVNKISSDNVQQNVELREAKKADHKQIIAAVDFINRGQGHLEREARTGFYSVDNRNIAIRWQGAGDFSVDIMETNWTITTRDNISQNAVTSLIDTACNAYEKSKDRKETIEAVDMGTQFSEAIFRKLCREISDSKDKVWEYQLSGQRYTVREVTAANAPALARYFAQFPNPQWRTVGFPNPIGTGEEIVDITAHIAQNTRTSTNQWNCTRDMGNEFSANIFRELCEEIGESKNGRWTYTLAGKKYEIRVDQPLPLDMNTAIFHVEHPNQFGMKVLAWGATLDALLDQQNHGALSHIHVHDPSKPAPFERQTMIDICNLAWTNPGRHAFDFHWATCHVYRGTGREKGRYCVDIPNNKGGVDTVRAISAKWLYDKFIERTNKLHHASSDKSAEWQETKKEGDEKHEKWWHDDAGHEADGTLYDKTVVGLLGSGLIGKALLGTRNLVPKWIRNTTGWITKSGLAGVGGSAVITGGLYGASVLGLTTMGTAAALSFFAPVALTIGGATAGYKFYRWWRWDGKKDGESSAHHS